MVCRYRPCHSQDFNEYLAARALSRAGWSHDEATTITIAANVAVKLAVIQGQPLATKTAAAMPPNVAPFAAKGSRYSKKASVWVCGPRACSKRSTPSGSANGSTTRHASVDPAHMSTPASWRPVGHACHVMPALNDNARNRRAKGRPVPFSSWRLRQPPTPARTASQAMGMKAAGIISPQGKVVVIPASFTRSEP